MTQFQMRVGRGPFKEEVIFPIMPERQALKRKDVTRKEKQKMFISSTKTVLL